MEKEQGNPNEAVPLNQAPEVKCYSPVYMCIFSLKIQLHNVIPEKGFCFAASERLEEYEIKH